MSESSKGGRVAVLFMLSGAASATVVQMLAQTSVRPGTGEFWLLVGAGALLTALVSALGLYPVKTRTDADRTPRSGALAIPPHNLPPGTAFFTGRDAEMRRLRQSENADGSAPRICVVHGLGGIGKSALARAYAEQQRGGVGLVRWLNASRPNTLHGELLDLAACVGIPYDMSHTVMLSRLWAWLRDQPSWLLVYDDWSGDLPEREAAGPDSLSALLPPEGAGQVLVTTQRHEDWGRLGYDVLELSPLAPEDGLRFLSARTRIPKGELRDLGDQLGWMPVELERAGALLQQTGMAAREYLDSLERLPARGSTFQLALEHVVEQVPASLDFLRLASFLASEDIPRSTLYRYYTLLPERLRRVMGNQSAFNDMILLLVRHSLIQRAGDGRTTPITYALHRSVQLSVRTQLGPVDRLEWSQAAVRLVEAAFPHSLDQPDARALGERLMPHVEASTAGLSWGDVPENPQESEAVVRLLHRAGQYQEYRCDWDRALALYRHETELRALGLGDAFDHAAAWLAVSRQHFYLADLDQAERTCHRALQLCGAPTADSPAATLRAQALCHLAGILRERVRFTDALVAAQQAIELYAARGSGFDTLDRAAAEHEAGLIHRNAGRLREAVACYARAEALVPQPGSQEPVEHRLFRAGLMRDRGIVAQDAGRLALAERQLRGAMLAFGTDPGGLDFETAQIAKFLADVLRRRAEADLRAPRWDREARRRGRARLREAETLLAPVVLLHASRGAADEQKYAACLNKRGSLELALGRPKDARETLHQAEAIYLEHYNEEHPYRAKTLSRLGPVLLRLGQREEAEDRLRTAKRIFTNSLGPDHPALAAVHQRLADVLDRAPGPAADGNREEAAWLRAEAHRITLAVRAATEPAQPTSLTEPTEPVGGRGGGGVRPSLRIAAIPPPRGLEEQAAD